MLYRHAPEVAEIVDELCAPSGPHHELFEAGIRIESLFMDKVPMSSGRLVAGRARRVSGLPAWWAQFGGNPERCERYEAGVVFGVVEIAWPIWTGLMDHQQVALVDHELCHFRIDWDAEPPALKLKGHDFEEFAAVIRRRGLWSSAARLAANAMAEELAIAIEQIEVGVQQTTNPADVDPDSDGEGGEG